MGDLIADDNSLDIQAWLEAKTFLIGSPIRLKAIAMKRVKGEALSGKEREYLRRWRKKEQASLV